MHLLLTFKNAAAMCHSNEEILRQAVKDGYLMTVQGCDGPDSDRIKQDDLDIYRARLRLAQVSGHATDD